MDRLPDEAQLDFSQQLHAKYSEVPSYLDEEPIWSPYLHSGEEFKRIIELQKALQNGLSAVLHFYAGSRNLRSLVPLSNQASYLFETDIDLTKQFIRPDYIFDQDGELRICEINTRFIFNGNIAAVHMAEFLAGRGFKHDTSNYQSLDNFMHRAYDGPDKTSIVVGVEPFHDLLLQKQRCLDGKFITPQQLLEQSTESIGKVILELHQHELEPIAATLANMIDDGVVFYNDPRVVWLLHDKRLLVALSDIEFMTDLIGKSDAEFLAAHIVESYHPKWPGREPERMIGKFALAKKSVSGKNDGLVVVPIRAYNEVLELPDDFVYQPKYRQPVQLSSTGERLEIAGTLPMTLGGEVFGPGIVRLMPHASLRRFSGFTVAMAGQ